ncbi:MAG: methionyl-tRNA formyltransferase [Anaerolineales bacterium]|nr:methionyl-tRNA formyltransferase [Anaerolineales bacterium]
MPPMTRIVFMGTPEFAVPSLHTLHQNYTVVGVVTQPDRAAGRGNKVAFSPVKQFAMQAGLPLIQPHKLREPDAQAQLAAWQPDLIVVAAFGQILKPAVLNLPPHGCINVHASLLPRWRGAAPIAASILAGDTETGCTIMHMDVGLDTGAMLAKRAEPIAADDTTATLTARLAQLGADLLIETLPSILSGTLTPTPQNDEQATYAPQLKKEDGHLNFAQTAEVLERRVRAFTPWPGTFALWNGQPVKILKTSLAPDMRGEPGTVAQTPRGVAVACGTGGLLLEVIQPAGKKPMPAADFARGARDFIGARLK